MNVVYGILRTEYYSTIVGWGLFMGNYNSDFLVGVLLGAGTLLAILTFWRSWKHAESEMEASHTVSPDEHEELTYTRYPLYTPTPTPAPETYAARVKGPARKKPKKSRSQSKGKPTSSRRNSRKSVPQPRRSR